MKHYVVHGLDMDHKVYFEADDMRVAVNWVNENLGEDIWDVIEEINTDNNQ